MKYFTYNGEPLDKLDEGLDDLSISHLLDDQDGEWGFVPRQSLAGRVLDGPVGETHMVRIHCLCPPKER